MRERARTEYNSIGSLVLKKLISIEDVYDMGIVGLPFHWHKYKPIIEEEKVQRDSYLKDLVPR